MNAEGLAKKLNLATPRDVLILAAPDAFAYGASQAPALLAAAAHASVAGGLLSVSYPKKASKRYASDLSRDSGAWAPLYERNLEPVRQVNVDEDRSFTHRCARSHAGKRRTEP